MWGRGMLLTFRTEDFEGWKEMPGDAHRQLCCTRVLVSQFTVLLKKSNQCIARVIWAHLKVSRYPRPKNENGLQLRNVRTSVQNYATTI
jgi:hypothetical protein